MVDLPVPLTLGTILEQISRLNTMSDQLVARTESAVGQLQTIAFQNVDLDPRLQWSDEDLQSLLNQLGSLPTFDSTTDWLANLTLSAGDSNFQFSPQILAMLSGQLPDYVLPPAPAGETYPDPPVDPGEPTPIPAPTRPTLPEHIPPDATVNEDSPVYEDFTAGVAFPSLRDIVLPTPPVTHLDDIVFDATEPTFNGVLPDQALTQFTPNAYNPLLVEETKAFILSMMNGERGLPPAVENALFERARETESELGEREVDQISTEFAARGYKYPPGAVAKRVDRARKDASKKISQLNRDQFIEAWKIQIEQFRQALSSAIALEEVWLKQYTFAEQLRFDVINMQVTFALSLFNAFVAQFNAGATMFGIKATIYKTRIEAEAMKIDAYAEELKAKQIIGELNAQDVAIYSERVKALLANAEIYKARIEGYTAKFAAIEAQVKVFEAELQSDQTLAAIYESDTKAFTSLVQAQGLREQRFATKADIYAKTVDATAAKAKAAQDAYALNFKKAELQRDTFIANSERIREYIAAESGRINALSQKYQALASEISAKSDVEKSKYTLMLGIAQASIARMQAAAEILLKNGEINIQAGIQATNLLTRARETAATTYAQLAAGFTSAASVNAGLSSSDSYSQSWVYTTDLSA